MRVKCIHDIGTNLSEEFLSEGWDATTKMTLTVGKEYVVYGISYFHKTINYLICDDYPVPYMYPNELFEISNNNIYTKWAFKSFPRTSSNTILAVFGYNELIYKEGHLEALLECDKEAEEIFYKRKKEIDTAEKLL